MASNNRLHSVIISKNLGTLAAYNAYRTYVAEDRKGVEEDRLPGLEQFSLNQIFWMSYANTWCTNMRERALIRRVMTFSIDISDSDTLTFYNLLCPVS